MKKLIKNILYKLFCIHNYELIHWDNNFHNGKHFYAKRCSKCGKIKRGFSELNLNIKKSKDCYIEESPLSLMLKKLEKELK